MKRHVKLLCLFIARSMGIFALCRRLTKSQMRILCYHGGCIGDELRFNPKLFLRADTLRTRMLWLKKAGFSIVRLDEAVSEKSTPAAALRAVVTFDDGWYSTGAELLPVMKEMRIPSTLYLCTKHFVEDWPVLPVALRYLLWKSTLLQVDIAGFGESLDGNHALETPEQRDLLADRVFISIEKFALDKMAVETALDQFAACLGVASAEVGYRNGAFSYMSADELRAASLNGCSIELHGHVHNYPVGDPVMFREDLMVCARVIDDLGLPKPKHYCYPSGAFDGGAPAVLRDLGVVSATTCVNRLVSAADKAQRYYLPRFLDGENVHMLEFQAEVSGFTEIARRCLGINSQTPAYGI